MNVTIKQNIRKWGALFCGIILYFIVHEGGHFLYASATGVFKQINIIGFGVQVDIFRDQMTDGQLAIFCLFGPLATLVAAYILIGFTSKLTKVKSHLIRAIAYYTSLAFLVIDPLYLSIVYSFVGGGDMNGIALVFPEMGVRLFFGLIFLINIVIIVRRIIPAYSKAYREQQELEEDES